jgi:hypothetical protein
MITLRITILGLIIVIESKQCGKDSIYILVATFSKKLKVTLLNIGSKEPLAL